MNLMADFQLAGEFGVRHSTASWWPILIGLGLSHVFGWDAKPTEQLDVTGNMEQLVVRLPSGKHDVQLDAFCVHRC